MSDDDIKSLLRRYLRDDASLAGIVPDSVTTARPFSVDELLNLKEQILAAPPYRPSFEAEFIYSGIRRRQAEDIAAAWRPDTEVPLSKQEV